jgi:cytochrome c
MRLSMFLIAAAVVIGGAGVAKAQDAAAGQAVFKTHGVVGRPAGHVPGFHYSAANKGSGLTWDAATLNRFITSPQTVVPKTSMPYAGLKDDKKRADLIAYLSTLH